MKLVRVHTVVIQVDLVFFGAERNQLLSHALRHDDDGPTGSEELPVRLPVTCYDVFVEGVEAVEVRHERNARPSAARE